MRKCACGEHIKHISMLEQNHEIQLRCVHSCLSDIGVLCSQNLWAFIHMIDWIRPPIAEVERHYLQNGRGNNNLIGNVYLLCMRSTMLTKCLITCSVRTATAHPT